MADLSSPFSVALRAEATALLEACRAKNLHIVTAESCTGGLIAALLTEIPGSSDVVDRGMVVYSNGAKAAQLGVPPALIDSYGAVSEEVARAMAEGALRHADAQLSIAVTGVAGPGGGTATKPVGLVHLASARAGGQTRHERQVFAGDRAAVRMATLACALRMLVDQAQARSA